MYHEYEDIRRRNSSQYYISADLGQWGVPNWVTEQLVHTETISKGLQRNHYLDTGQEALKSGFMTTSASLHWGYLTSEEII